MRASSGWGIFASRARSAIDTDLLAAIQQAAVREAKVKTNEKLRLATLGYATPENSAAP